MPPPSNEQLFICKTRTAVIRFLFLLIGSITILFATVFLFPHIKPYIFGMEKVEGRVVGYESDQDYAGNGIYAPIIEYHRKDNDLEQFTDYYYADTIKEEYPLGKVVSIYYHPDYKKVPVINVFPSGSVVSLIIGFVIFIFGGTFRGELGTPNQPTNQSPQ